MPTCVYGVGRFVEAFALSIATQRTLGYGNSGPQHCWLAAWVIFAQALVEVLLSAAAFGVVFAVIAQPKHRSTSIAISDTALISRRDGILK